MKSDRLIKLQARIIGWLLLLDPDAWHGLRMFGNALPRDVRYIGPRWFWYDGFFWEFGFWWFHFYLTHNFISYKSGRHCPIGNRSGDE